MKICHVTTRLLLGLLLGAAFWGQPAKAADGDLDATFGDAGKVLTALDTTTLAYGIALQPDGKIVGAGAGVNAFSLARYLTDGSLDETFGGDGKVSIPFDNNAGATDVAISPDGKIYAAGVLSDGTNNLFCLIRFKADGSLDESFDSDGIAVSAFGTRNANCNAMALQPDGKIILAGTVTDGTASVTGDIGLLRYLPDGTLDETFGNGGQIVLPVPTGSTTNSCALQLDGKILVAGSSGSNMLASRFLSDGSVDSSFGTDGEVEITYPAGESSARGVTLQGNGKILIAGYASDGTKNRFALTRLTSGGVLDTSFGTAGRALGADIDSHGWVASFTKSGKIVVGGYVTLNFTPNVALERFNLDGSLDTSFGNNGVASTTLGNGDSSARDIAIQQNGKIVTIGPARVPEKIYGFGLARFDGGVVDKSPSITQINPAAAPIGAPLDIAGFNFLGATTVTVGATAKAQEFTVIDANRIRIPALAPGTETGKVRVYTRWGQGVSPVPFHLTPQISGFDPGSGPVGAVVTITGTGFRLSSGSNVTAVRFKTATGYVSAKVFNVVSKTQLTVKVPVGAISGPIRVRNGYGASESEQPFTVTGSPAKTSPSAKVS